MTADYLGLARGLAQQLQQKQNLERLQKRKEKAKAKGQPVVIDSALFRGKSLKSIKTQLCVCKSGKKFGECCGQRNKPCFCQSGKKYKNCHLKELRARSRGEEK